MFYFLQVGVATRIQVRVQNISEVSKWIRFHGISESNDFDVKYENPEAQTPPGLEATAEVIFNGRPVPEDGEQGMSFQSRALALWNAGKLILFALNIYS